MENKTITAIATPIGTAGVGIIRLSGKNSLEITKKIFKPFNINEKFTPRKMIFGRIQANEWTDDCLCVYFKAPNSFTGEDVVELQMHGGVYLLNQTLQELLNAGATMAEPGEFSKRAVMNGKMDITQAEALIDLLKRADKMEEKEVYKEFSEISPFSSVDVTAQDIARIAVTEDFNSYIQKISNSFGKANSETKLQFEKLGLDYDKWLNFSETESIELNNHSYNIKLWDRNPQKDLFMGNRTSCCTAVIDGANGKATPIYLSNTAFNVIELTDENGNIVGMSRIFVGIVDEKPSIIIENIELNNAFIKDKTQEELKFLRDNIFDYIANFASGISDNEKMNIYFSKNYTHVPTDDFELETKNIDFAGTLSSSNIYLNCKPGWTTPQELKEEPCELYRII